jgi:ADP-heptose:LPS heptosyltransferase
VGRLPHRPRLPPEPRILVARPDHLGDLLLTLPALAALRRRLPGARISCLVPSSLLPVTARARDVDDALAMPLSIEQDPSRADAGVIERTVAELRGRFDLALLPRPHDPWSGAVVAAARVPVRVGHSQPGMDRFLTHALPENRRRHVAREAVVLAVRGARLL